VIAKEMQKSKQDQVDAFNRDVQQYTGELDNINILVGTKYGIGDHYKTITQVEQLHTKDLVDLEHQQGQVWLIIFWSSLFP